VIEPFAQHTLVKERAKEGITAAHLYPVGLVGKAHGQLDERGEGVVAALSVQVAPVQDGLQQRHRVGRAHAQRLLPLLQALPAHQQLPVLACNDINNLMIAGFTIEKHPILAYADTKETQEY
jgi:hypothetical protein